MPGAGITTVSKIKPESKLTIYVTNEKPEGIFYDARKIEGALKEEYKINILDDIGV